MNRIYKSEDGNVEIGFALNELENGVLVQFERNQYQNATLDNGLQFKVLTGKKLRRCVLDEDSFEKLGIDGENIEDFILDNANNGLEIETIIEKAARVVNYINIGLPHGSSFRSQFKNQTSPDIDTQAIYPLIVYINGKDVSKNFLCMQKHNLTEMVSKAYEMLIEGRGVYQNKGVADITEMEKIRENLFSRESEVCNSIPTYNF